MWRCKIAIKNGDLVEADSLINNTIGTTFRNTAQLLYNSSLIGFNSKLNATGVPNLKNVKYDVFNSDTATSNYMMFYNSTDKQYETIDLTDILYYIVISGAYTGSANANIKTISSGKYLIYDSTLNANQEVQRAKVWDLLLNTGKLAEFTGVTSIKVSDSNDVGYRGYKTTWSKAMGAPSPSFSADSTGTFGTTTGNVVSSWSNMSCSGGNVLADVYWQVPTSTNLNGKRWQNGDAAINEIGTNLQADEKSNPATCKIGGSSYSGTTTLTVNATIIILTKGTLSWADTNSPTRNSVDYYTTYSIPETTQADTLANEGASDGVLIFQTTSLPTIKDCIATWNSSIDSENTLTVSISADGTNYEEVTDATIHRFTNTGTNLFVKFEIDRVDTSAVDKISEYAILYNCTGEV